MSVFNRLFGKKDPQRRPLDLDQLMHAFEQFVDADTWSESQRIVEQNPVLLHPDADDILRQLAAAQSDPQTRQAVDEDRSLLRRCHEVGIEQAFAEKTGAALNTPLFLLQRFFEANTWTESWHLLKQNPVLLSNEIETLLSQLTEQARALGHVDTCRQMEETQSLLRSCRGVGVASAIAEAMMPLSAFANALAADAASEDALEIRRLVATLGPEIHNIMISILESNVEVKSPEDIHRAIAERPDLTNRWEAVLQSLYSGMNPPARYRPYIDQARSADRRYNDTGDSSALDEAVAAWEQILAHPSFDYSDRDFRLDVLNDAATVMLRRHWLSGSFKDLNRATEMLRMAVLGAEADSPRLPLYLTNLGIALVEHYSSSTRTEDLEEAIGASERAVHLAESNSLESSMYYNNLANGLRLRYYRTGNLKDLDRVILLSEQAVQGAPKESVDYSGYLSNLGVSLTDRYQQTGRMEDLERIIQVTEQAVHLTSLETPSHTMFLHNLGNGLQLRYARTGRLADLEDAMRLRKRLVDQTPLESPDLPSRLNNLSSSLLERYKRTGQTDDLEEMVRLLGQARNHALLDSNEMPLILNNLALGLHAKYQLTRKQVDLDEAIRSSRDAIAQVTTNSPALPGYLNGLGLSLNSRYKRTKQSSDLAEAVNAFREALERTPLHSTELPGYCSNLGTVLSTRYARSQRLEDLEEARGLYKRACLGGLFVQPESAVSSAHNWGNWALQRQEWLEATEAYDYGRQAIDDLFATQTSRAAKEAWLREAQGLPANAAYALARLVRLEKAVATLEAGRARLLAEALEQNRRDLEQLEPLGYKAVLDRYRTASERVTALQKQASQPTTQFLRDTSQSSNHPVTQLDYSTWRQQLEQARAELDAAIAAIRQVPGYQDFFLPPSFEKIQHAATPDAPLVYLAATPVGSVALVVRAPQTLRVSVEPGSSPNGDSPANHDQTRRVSVVWLDGFNEADLDALLVERQDGQVTGGYLPGQLGDSDALHASLAQVLPRLGQALLGPLAAHLRSLGVAGVVLVPAGRLSLLPLHAASYPADGQERCLLDEFSVRYAPSAVALASAHGEAQRRRAPLRLAGVGNPLPDVATTGTWASQQARTIVQRLPAAAANPALDHARQTLQAVATATPQEAIRAGDLLLAALRDLALGGAALDLVLAALEIAQRIPPSLDYAEAELRSVLDLLPGDGAWAAYGEQATRDALWQALPAATTLHLACHGQFNPQQPLDSALLLAAGSRITLRELLERDNSAALAGLRLAFLSACQTAIADFRNVPDEAVGLPAAFLQAGIPAVVGTLWPVNDASTALLATRFYELYLHGDPAAGLAPQGPAAALQAAQRWLRDVTNAELASYLEGHRRLKEASEQQQERMSWALIKETRREVRRAVAAGQGDARPYEAAYHWAPFVFYGAG